MYSILHRIMDLTKYDANKLKKKVSDLEKMITNNEADFGEVISVSSTEQHEELVEVSQMLQNLSSKVLEVECEYLNKEVLTAIPKDISLTELKKILSVKNSNIDRENKEQTSPVDSEDNIQ